MGALVLLVIFACVLFYVVKAMSGGRARVEQAQTYARNITPTPVPAHGWQPADPSVVPVDRCGGAIEDWWNNRSSIKSVQCTTLDGVAVTAFDVHVPQRQFGLTLACVRVELADLSMPDLTLRSRKTTGHLLATAEPASAVNLESDDFNHAFRIDTHDSSFAFEMLDARMIELLLATPYLCSLDFAGGAITAAFTSEVVENGGARVLTGSQMIGLIRNRNSPEAAAQIVDQVDAERCSPDQRLAFIGNLVARLPNVVRTKYCAPAS